MKPKSNKPGKSNGSRQEPLNLQVYRIDGDLVELLFIPREIDLRVGETLTLRERETGRSVIAQVIAFRSASYPSLVQEQMLNLLGPEPLDAPLLEAIGYRLFVQTGGNGRSAELGNIKVALAKIRKTVPADQPALGTMGWLDPCPGCGHFPHTRRGSLRQRHARPGAPAEPGLDVGWA